MNIENFRKTQKWKTFEGQEILIKDLTDEHIKNIINRNASHNKTIIPYLKQELIYRKKLDEDFLKMFKRNLPYIKELIKDVGI